MEATRRKSIWQSLGCGKELLYILYNASKQTENTLRRHERVHSEGKESGFEMNKRVYDL